MIETKEEKIERLTKLGETCRKIIEGEINIFQSIDENNYDFFISKFIYNKEKNITKRMENSKNFYLDFNLDDNKNIVWDMLFLSEVINRQITDSNAIKEILTKMLNVNLIGETYNSNKLTKTEKDKLKKSVVIYQKTRDSLSHNPNDKISYLNKEDNTLIINNNHKNNLLQCKVPFQYIERFGNGIIPIEEHKELAKEIDEITSNIFFKLGYNIKETPGFIYRTHPSVLKYLLEITNGNIEKLKELPEEIFFCDEKKLRLILSKFVGQEIENLKYLPKIIFKGKENNIKIILKLVNYNIKELKDFPEEAYYCEENRLTLILKLINNDIEKLKKLPKGIFICLEQTIDYVFKIINIDINQSKNISEGLFHCSKERINLILKKAKGDITKLNNLPVGVFISEEKRINRLLQIVNNNLEKLKGLPEEIFHCPETRLNIILSITGENIEKVKDFPEEIFTVSEEKLKFILEKLQININNITNVKKHIFNAPEENIIFLLNILKNNFEEIRNLPRTIIYSDIERIMFLLKKFNFDIKILKELPSVMFSCHEERIIYLLDKYKGDLEKIKQLPEEIFYCSKLRLDIILKYPQETIKNFPQNIYYLRDEKFDYLFEKVNKNLTKMQNIPYEIENCSLKRIKKILNETNINIENLGEVSEGLFKCSETRLDNILQKTNGNIEEIKKIPYDLFMCDDNIFEELYNTHELNLIKSIFGISDEKLIILMIYMNTVFSNYQEEIKDKDIDISRLQLQKIPQKIIDKSKTLDKKLEESINKKNILKELSIRSYPSSTIGSFIGTINKIPSDESLKKDITEINNEFIRIIGNSSRHFRIYKQDDNKVILEDYTKDKDGNLKIAFRALSTIEELYQITSSLISKDISTKINNEEIIEKVNITNSNKYTKEQLETVNQELEHTKIQLVKKILVQICLNKKQIIDITELKENNIVFFEYVQDNGTKIKRELEYLYQYFKNIDTDIFKEAINEYNKYLQEKQITILTGTDTSLKKIKRKVEQN